jgi:3-deoxy-D-manno-octulosonic acid (KDO) 8-phosphate synthase
MIETHDDPAAALSDGPQAVPLDELGPMLASFEALGAARSDADGASPPPFREMHSEELAGGAA